MVQSQSLSKEDLPALRDQLMSELPRLLGRVRKVKLDKGFGFIAGDDGIDYFFHWSGVKKSSPKQLRGMAAQDRVEFSPTQPPAPSKDADKPGPRAIEVIYIEG